MSEFKVGDKVRVVKKVDVQNGWQNNWVSMMDDLIGTTQVIREIDKYGIKFQEGSQRQICFGFPSSALELVQEYKPAEVRGNAVKYQYIKPFDWEISGEPELKGLCISLSTEITQQKDGRHIVKWAVTFKNPKDQFCKKEARTILNARPKQLLEIDRKYSRDEILAKILSCVFYDELCVPYSYKKYLRRVLSNVYWG